MARITIASLLLPGDVLDRDVWGRLEPVLTPVKVAAAAAGARVPWPYLEKHVKTNIRELLGIDVHDLVIAAWQKAEELQEYGDRTKHPPEEVIITELAEHTIEVTYDPFLEVLVNEQPTPEIKLNVVLSLIMKGLILTIQDGKIRELQSGSLTGKGKIEVGERTVLEGQFEPINLPGKRAVDESTPE